MTDVYRLAASILVLRPMPDGRFELLLLRKPRKKDAWQLPQGGVEAGESMEEAAVRELKEEAGVEHPRVIGASREIYQYTFPQSFRRFRPDNVCGQKIAFVFAVVPPETVVLVDNKEVTAFLWADEERLKHYVKRREYLDLILRLYTEALQHVKTGA